MAYKEGEEVKAEATVITTVAADFERIERLLDVVEAVARVRMDFLIPITNLAITELKQHGAAAQEELDALAEAAAEAAAVEAAKVKEEEEARRKEEEEANQPLQQPAAATRPVPDASTPVPSGQGQVRRELPPLNPPPRMSP